MRLLTTATRQHVEEIIKRLGNGAEVSLKERIELRKYALHIPFIAGKLEQALRRRKSLDKEGLI